MLTVEAAPVAQAATFGFHGQLRQRYIRVSDFALDAEGVEHEQSFRDTMRLHLVGEMRFTRLFWIRSTVQLLDGQVLGESSPVTNGLRGTPFRNRPLLEHFQLRESVVQFPVGIGVIRLGRFPVHWGLGMVANDGEHDTHRFGDATHGDIVNGIWADIQPLYPFTQGRLGHAIHLGLGVDIVELDELVSRPDGDLAFRIVSTLTWEEPRLNGGLYFALRTVDRAGDASATHVVVDANAHWHTQLGEDFELSLDGEVAMVTGSAKTAQPDGEYSHSAIRQFGALADASLRDTARGLDYGVRVGFASGDQTPGNRYETAFRFDPAYKVGMVLFEEVMGRVSARGWERLSEADRADVAPGRLDYQPTDGSISNAFFVAPRVGWTLCEGCFLLEAAGLFAFAPESVVDPTGQSGEGARALTSHGAIAEAGPLGYELNAGATVAFDLESWAHLSIGTQYGFFVPGSALAAATDAEAVGVVHKFRLLADLRW